MKKLFLLGALFLGILSTPFAHADDAMNQPSKAPAASNTQNQDNSMNYQDDQQQHNMAQMHHSNGYYQGGYQGNEGCCPEDHPVADVPMNDCWCMYCHYEPCYYTTKRCVEEQIPCKKKCYRYVPEYYEVQRCRYVPQYYNETCCRQKCECYYVDDCKTCKKYVCDTHCRYVPRYYWKHTVSGECQPCSR